MRSSSRLIAAAVAGVALLCLSSTARAQQPGAAPQTNPIAMSTAWDRTSGPASLPGESARGSIAGVVQDERGAPVVGAMVSVIGAMTAVAVTDRGGRFEFRSLTAGPYLVRAHITGYMGSRGQVVDVRSSARSVSAIAVRHVNPIGDAASVSAVLPPAVLEASLGGAIAPQAPSHEPVAVPSPGNDVPEASTTDDDHGEVAWRLRHLRRGILRDVVVPTTLLADEAAPDPHVSNPLLGGSGRGDDSQAFATSLFAGTPLTGQFNLLTTGSFDSPQQLFAGDNLSRGIADMSLRAPIGEYGDWSMRGALTQGDISSWFVAGAYANRSPGRHQYDVGLSYSTQRYDGGNPAALRNVTDGSRNVGAVYGFDTMALGSSAVVTYGARFSRYDYLTDAEGGLLSPRVEVTLSPVRFLRVKALASSGALAPGAEEFLPPIDIGLWLPPQRTFSSIVDGGPLQPERTNHLAVEVLHDVGESTISFRVFRQQVTDQLVTIFGLDVPAARNAQVGHYFVANEGDVDANGWSAAVRTAIVPRVHASLEYSLTNARWARNASDDAAYLLLVAPSVVRPTVDRIHSVSTSFETDVPETSTRVVVMCGFTSGRPPVGSDRNSYDSRFDVQVHQSLPFMDFSSARWEMLLAVRNTFRDGASESSVYDELLVSRPPKRIVGGITLRF